jgi:outer membrane protein assembly factor BamB
MKKGDKELLERYSPYRSCTPLTFNGQPLPSPGAVRSSPVVVNGVLYVGTGLGSAATACWGYMYALDALTGKLHWKLTDKDITDHRSEYAVGVNNSPCVYKGRAHFSYGVYTAVDIETGRIAVKGGTVPEKHKFRGWWDRFPPTYTRHDGKAVRYWVDPLLRAHAGVRGGLTVAEEHNLILAVYRTICRPDKVERLVGKKKRQVSPNAIRVFAVDANSGEVQWEGWADQDGWKLFEEPAAIYNGKVYISGGKGIAVFDLKKGSDKKIKLAWVNPIRHKPWSKFIVEPEQVFSGVEGSVMTAPAIANGLIFAGADDGCVYAWDLKSGEVAWKYTTGGKVRSSPAVAKGKLYIGSDDGYVYCFGNK